MAFVKGLFIENLRGLWGKGGDPERYLGFQIFLPFS
nr:MAG TPA: hypothetical protein [Caudoviricetes sp.]